MPKLISHFLFIIPNLIATPSLPPSYSLTVVREMEWKPISWYKEDLESIRLLLEDSCKCLVSMFRSVA